MVDKWCRHFRGYDEEWRFEIVSDCTPDHELSEGRLAEMSLVAIQPLLRVQGRRIYPENARQ